MIKKGLFSLIFSILFLCNTSMNAIPRKYVRGALTVAAVLVGFNTGLTQGGTQNISRLKKNIPINFKFKEDITKRIIDGLVCAALVGTATYFGFDILFNERINSVLK